MIHSKRKEVRRRQIWQEEEKVSSSVLKFLTTLSTRLTAFFSRSVNIGMHKKTAGVVTRYIEFSNGLDVWPFFYEFFLVLWRRLNLTQLPVHV